MADYKELVKQSLAQTQQFAQQNISLLELVNENYRLKINQLQNDIKENENIIESQKNRDKRYEKTVNITNNTLGDGSVIANKISDVGSIGVSQKECEKANSVQVQNDATFN